MKTVKPRKNPLVMFIHKLGSPPWFYDFTGKFVPWLWAVFAGLTVWGMYPLAGVKVSVDIETTPSDSALELNAIVTSAVGAMSSATSNVAAPPVSDVTRPEAGKTVIPGALDSLTRYVSRSPDWVVTSKILSSR